MDDDEAERATMHGVRETYDRIAGHFSETRAHPWPQIPDFLDGRTGGVGLDLGCGNGRHVESLTAHCERVVGVDLSRTLLDAATERVTQPKVPTAWVQGDAGALPIRTATVDLGLYIAALHHLPSRPARQRSLDELARVLTADGAALVSAWSTTHDRFNAETGFDTTVDWTLPSGETVPRYYHIYDPDEFAADLAASNLQVIQQFTKRGNCFAVVQGEGKRT